MSVALAAADGVPAPVTVGVPPLIVPTNDIDSYPQVFAPGLYLAEGAIIAGQMPESAVLPRADPLARVPVRILCGTAIVYGDADRSSSPDYLGITVTAVELGDSRRKTPISGFAIGVGAAKPGVRCTTTDDRLITSPKAHVRVYLTAGVFLPDEQPGGLSGSSTASAGLP